MLEKVPDDVNILPLQGRCWRCNLSKETIELGIVRLL